tara:strand:+ start:57 stop:218 length:162 start_codon:yes stop_codon:yes gene_type:complete
LKSKDKACVDSYLGSQESTFAKAHRDVTIKRDRLILNERTSKGGYPKGLSKND